MVGKLGIMPGKPEALRGVTRLPSEYFAQIVVDRRIATGLTPTPTWGRDLDAPLKATTGTQDNCLSPFFLILTTKPPGISK